LDHNSDFQVSATMTMLTYYHKPMEGFQRL